MPSVVWVWRLQNTDIHTSVRNFSLYDRKNILLFLDVLEADVVSVEPIICQGPACVAFRKTLSS